MPPVSIESAEGAFFLLTRQNISRGNEKIYEFGGFTLFELITVIFMIAFVSTFAVPGVMSWRSAAKLRGAAENLKGNLELAKMKAIQLNGPVAVHFRKDAYQIFVDNGANAGILDSDEQIIRNITLSPGIRFDFAATTFRATDGDWPKKARFLGRGTANNGTAVLINQHRTKGKAVTVSNLGKITLKNFQP